MGLRRTRGGFLHPKNVLAAREVGLEVDPRERDTLRLKIGNAFDYVRLPIDLENFHVQNDFSDASDVDATDTWVKDNAAVGSGETDLALVAPAYDLNEKGWLPKARMITGDKTDDYISYQAKWHSISWPKDLTTQYANTSDEYWISQVEFGVQATGVGGYVPSTAFVGWVEEITNPGVGEVFDFDNGFGWIVSYGTVTFRAKVDGVTTIDMDVTDEIGRPVENGDMLRLGMGWFPGTNTVMLRMAKNANAYSTKEAVKEVSLIMPGGVELKTSMAIMTEMDKSVELQMRYYKYMTPKNSQA